MGVAHVVISDQGLGGKRNRGAGRVQPAVSDVGVGQAMKQIVGSAILLEDDNHMLNLLRERGGSGLKWNRRSASAAPQKQGENCKACRQGKVLIHSYLRCEHSITPTPF